MCEQNSKFYKKYCVICPFLDKKIIGCARPYNSVCVFYKLQKVEYALKKDFISLMETFINDNDSINSNNIVLMTIKKVI